MERLTGNDNKFFQDGMDEHKVSTVYFKLKAYEDAEEQGLPCKVGDAAFVLEVENEDGGEERIFEGEVISFFLADGQVYATIGNMEYDCWFSEVARRLSDIGVDWFLTHEEAEKALEGANRNG